MTKWSVGSRVFVVALWLLVVAVVVCHAGESVASIRNSLVAGGNIYGNNILASLSVVNVMGFSISPLSNNFYIYEPASDRNNVIRKVDSQSGIITQVSLLPYRVSSFFGMITFAKDSEEIVYLNGFDDFRLVKYNLTNGSYVTYDDLKPKCVIEYNDILYVGQEDNILSLNLTSGISQTLVSAYMAPSQFVIYNNDLYFSDYKTLKVKKMSLATNEITEVACNGNYGYSGDGANAIDAACKQVYGLAIDRNGNLVFSDYDNQIIRMVNLTTGIITTVMENIQAKYLQVTNNGELYLSTLAQILKLTIFSNGTVSTSIVAGSGESSFTGYSSDLPANLVTLPSDIIPTVQTFTNDIYISYLYSNLMLKIRNSDNIVTSNEVLSISGIGSDPISNDIYFVVGLYLKKMSGVNGTISVIAGTSENNNITAKFIKNEMIQGMAFYGSDLYYSDGGKLVIRKIDGKTGIGIIVAAFDSRPKGITFTNSGDMLIADNSAHVIRKIAKNGDVSIIAGVEWKNGYNGDNIAATDSYLQYPNYILLNQDTNEIFITEYSRIRKISSNGNITTIAGSSDAGFNSSATLAVDSQVNQPNCIFFNGSDLYFCDTNNYRLRKIDENGLISTVAGNGESYSLSADGSTLANETGIGYVVAGVIDPLTGDIYIATYYVIYRILAESGKIITLAGKEGKIFNGENVALNEKTFTYIYSLLIKDNMLYISHANMISAISLSKDSNQIVETITGSSGDGGLAIDRQINPSFSPIKITTGDIYFNEGTRIRKISKQTNIISTILGSGITGIDCSSELDVLATRTCVELVDFDVDEKTGIIYFIEGSGVKMIDNQGYIRLVVGSKYDFAGDNGPAINASLLTPISLLVVSNSLLIADTGNNRIRKIDLKSNIISTLVGNGNTDYTPGENVTEISIKSPKYLTRSRNNEIYYTFQFGSTSIINKLTPYCTQTNYTLDGLNCLPTCFGSTTGCLFGNCIEVDTCECQYGYYGSKCEKFDCNGISFNSSNVCSGKGSCLSPNNCSCNSGYYGNNCELFNCSSISNISPNVCSTRNGTCISPNNCSCNSGYYGLNCELFDCFGISNLKISSCSGKGLCLAYNSCSCLAGYSGKQCEISPKVSQSTKVSTSFKLNSSNSLAVFNGVLTLFITFLFFSII